MTASSLETMNKIEQIKTYKEVLLTNTAVPLPDEVLGMVNGLEMALALLESRPTFYLDKNKKFNTEDIKNYPDYFI